MNRDDLTEDQEKAIDRLYNFDETFLIAPTGAGKTAIVLTAIRELINEGILSRVLIIAPLKVCLTTWATEAQKWEHLTGLKVSIVVGDPYQRLATMSANTPVVVVNEENAAWLFDNSYH